jgi:serine protease Do/serine protease DegQ
MMRFQISRLGCVLLLAGIAAASAQDRVLGPLPSLAPLVEEVAPAVVNIAVTGRAPLAGGLTDPLLERFFADQLPRERRGEGSGVIVDARQGYLITNHHVIENADEITVTLADDRTFPATVVGSDADSDVAVLKIEASGLTDIPFASVEDLRVGDYVVAIGNPLGFENTVTSGIISGLSRSVLNDGNAYEDFIQTDASINVGNSGGALVNLRGELIGINSAIISQTGGNIGIGLAIPADMAVSVMEQLIEFGEVRRGFLGIQMSTVTQDFANEYGLAVNSGALVTVVLEGSAAEAAGIQIDDVLVGVNGASIASGNELRNRVGLMHPGDEVEIELVRDGRRMTQTAVLGRRPAANEVVGETGIEDDTLFDGVVLVETQFAGVAGLAVASIAPDSPAAAQGLAEGDLITNINRQRVSTLAEARAIVSSARVVVAQIRRGNREVLIRLR